MCALPRDEQQVPVGNGAGEQRRLFGLGACVMNFLFGLLFGLDCTCADCSRCRCHNCATFQKIAPVFFQAITSSRDLKTASECVENTPLNTWAQSLTRTSASVGRPVSLKLWPCRFRCLMDRLGLARHVIHQEVLTEGIRGGEIRFAAAHLGNFLDELNQAVL